MQLKPTHAWHDVFLKSRFFLLWGFVAVWFIAAYFLPILLIAAKALALFAAGITLLDYALLFLIRKKLYIRRVLNEHLSNGDLNPVQLRLSNLYPIPLQLEIIDELPEQFQKRDFLIHKDIPAQSKTVLQYQLRPTQRGEYDFGDVHVFASTRIGVVCKRFTAMQEQTVKVYPSFIQLKKYALQAIPDLNTNTGNKILYRRGFSTEFDHIKEYNRGDDSRMINWKASARRNQLMVNSFMDEKSQQIYCLIDKGRLMKMPFDDLTLLDYAINAVLMFSYVAIQKNDKVGLLTFNEKVNDHLPASKSKKHFNTFLETLYKQQTQYLESDLEALYKYVNKKMVHRGLMMLFTNFETWSGFERQLPYFRALNQKHLLCIVFFENTEINKIHENRGDDIEDIYIKTIADKFLHEKKKIVTELRKIGILTIFSEPKKLTVQVVNKYLELKSKQII